MANIGKIKLKNTAKLLAKQTMTSYLKITKSTTQHLAFMKLLRFRINEINMLII